MSGFNIKRRFFSRIKAMIWRQNMKIYGIMEKKGQLFEK
jgi:hypothetical protein